MLINTYNYTTKLECQLDVFQYLFRVAVFLVIEIPIE